MKAFIVLGWISVISYNLFGQTEDQVKKSIDSLQNRKREVVEELKSIDDKITKQEKLLDKIKATSSSNPIVIKAPSRLKVLDQKSTVTGLVLGYVEKDQPTKLLSYEGDFFTIEHSSTIGYVYYIYFSGKEIEDFKTLWNKINAETRLRKENDDLTKKASQQTAHADIRLKVLTERFGIEIASKIITGQVWIGMSPEMAKLSLGDPEKINESISVYGVNQQWIYKGKYLYFDDGKLKSWQESK